MIKFDRKFKELTFPICIVLLLTFARLIPHPPNFTPIIAVAIMGGYLFKNFTMSLMVITISMLVSDIFLKFHDKMFYTYLSLFVISYFFFKISTKINKKNFFVFVFIGSLIFYIITNFGAWISSDMYEKNFNGLFSSYVMALPFFKNTLISTLIFSYIALFADSFYKKASIK